MADNEPTISMAGINAPPLYRLVEDGDKTVIVTADTNTPMWVINGKIGGDTVETMTTAERTAITPEAGQLIFDTTLGALFVGDGSTQGGTAVGGGGGGGVVPGYRLSDDGTALNFNPVQPIVTVTGSSVTLAPDTAYKMYATTGAVTINANPPASGYWGLESHIELFVGSTGYVVTGTNVVLANALEPDSVNNCTVRFHDGIAIISVEDHVAGYIVVSGSTSGDGSLYYGISTSTNDYVAFDASLNGSVIPLAGAVAEGEKHLVGNGYTSTTLTGAVDCGENKVTVANLGLNNVQITGGTMTLGDAYIPSGSTVSIEAAGKIQFEKVVGNGGVINLNGLTNPNEYNGVYVSGVKIVSGIDAGTGGLGIFNVGNTANVTSGTFKDVSFEESKITNQAVFVRSNGVIELDGCTFANYRSNGTIGGHVDVKIGNGTLITSGCTFTNNGGIAGIVAAGSLRMLGSNSFPDANVTHSGTVVISSGAILDLTGNTNATPIAPGGGIVVSGGCQVITSAGTTATVSLGGGTLSASTIGNTAEITLPSGQTSLSGYVELSNGSFDKPSGSIVPLSGSTVNFTNWSVSGNLYNHNNVYTVNISGTFGQQSGITRFDSATVNIANGTVLDYNGNTVADASGTAMYAGTLTVGTGVKFVNVSGSTVDLAAGTYSSVYIAKNGTIVNR